MNMASYDYDLIVIGSGAGGAIAAQQVAKAGKRVAIVESALFGGTETTVGSVPVAALLQAARTYESAKNGARFGVRGATIGYNYPTVKAWKDLVVKRTGIHSGEDAFAALGINVVRGRAYFIDPHTISIGAARFTSKQFLIATGSETVLPNTAGFAKSGFMTTQEAVNLTRPPKRLLVLGGGAYSYELAQLFAIFGSKVYLVEDGSRVLSGEEPAVSELIETRFNKDYSMSILTETTLEKVETSTLDKKITVLKSGKRAVISVDEIVVATPKKAATDIGLENAGVVYTEGAIHTDATLQTSTGHIFAAGSCTGIQGSGHMAAYQSQVVAHNILHAKKTYCHRLPRRSTSILFKSRGSGRWLYRSRAKKAESFV